MIVDATKNSDLYRKHGSYNLIVVDNYKRVSEKELKFLLNYVLMPRTLLEKGKIVRGKEYL